MYNSARSKATAASKDKHTSPKSSSNSIEKKPEISTEKQNDEVKIKTFKTKTKK